MKHSITDRFFSWSPWGVVVTAVALCIGSLLASDWVNTALFSGCSVIAVYLAWYETRWLQQVDVRTQPIDETLPVPASEAAGSHADRRGFQWYGFATRPGREPDANKG